MTPEQKNSLNLAVDQFNRVFGNDLDLVRQAAIEHHVNLTQGNTIQLPTPGAYNLRVPQNSSIELDALTHGKKLLVACMDYRQSAQVVTVTEPNAFLLMAGGATQPDLERLNTLVDFLYVVHQVNPHITLILLAHNKICGGNNHFTKGAVQNMSPSDEINFLTAKLHKTSELLTNLTVPVTSIKLGIAKINSNNQYTGIQYLQ